MDPTAYPYKKSRLTLRCFIRAFAFVAPIVMLAPRPAEADLIITATNLSVLPGGTGIMDFYISSDSSDTLSDFTLQLLASPVAGSPEGVLEFTATQTDYPYGNPNYVFYGESTDDYYGPGPFWSAPSPSAIDNPAGMILGGDSDDSALGYITLSTTPMLLATVQVYLQPTVLNGERYQVSLLPQQYPGIGLGETNFDDPLSYTSTPGTVSVTSLAASPEPAPLVSVIAALALIAISRRCTAIAGRGTRRPEKI
jgi:hypothetical protein